jgi:hypothetical protein
MDPKGAGRGGGCPFVGVGWLLNEMPSLITGEFIYACVRYYIVDILYKNFL